MKQLLVAVLAYTPILGQVIELFDKHLELESVTCMGSTEFTGGSEADLVKILDFVKINGVKYSVEDETLEKCPLSEDLQQEVIDLGYEVLSTICQGEENPDLCVKFTRAHVDKWKNISKAILAIFYDIKSHER